jgi:redox-sensitive bicupin YhaK (pirin superfamily)
MWIQVLRGAVTVNGTQLNRSDGAAITNEDTVKISANDAGEIMVFELAD